MHWSGVGSPDANDESVLTWARHNSCVLITHDLDFSAILANSNAETPSVVQVRTQDVAPATLGDALIRLLRTHQDMFARGAIITLDADRARVRILPIAD